MTPPVLHLSNLPVLRRRFSSPLPPQVLSLLLSPLSLLTTQRAKEQAEGEGERQPGEGHRGEEMASERRWSGGRGGAPQDVNGWCRGAVDGEYRWPNGTPGPSSALARSGPARRGPALYRHGGLPCRAVSDHRAEVATQARH
jgi:hypothetical protein